MLKRIGILLIAGLSLWVLLVVPARILIGPETIPQSAVALLLCLVPGAATLALAAGPGRRTPEAQLLALFGGMGLRMVVVLGAGIVLYARVEVLRGWGFWVFLIIFYLATLAVEVVLLVSPSTGEAPAPK